MNQTFIDCLSFNEFQELGRESISTVVAVKYPEEHISVYDSKPVSQKRVKFVFDAQPKAERLLKSEHFIVISRSINLSEREQMYKWFDDRGFELIWSLEAALEYSSRNLIHISHQDQDELLHHQRIKNTIIITNSRPFSELIHIEGAYFWIQT